MKFTHKILTLVGFALGALLVGPQTARAADAPLVIVQKASVSAAAASGVTSAATSTSTVTVPGAKLGDACIASHSVSIAGLIINCAITGTNTATVSYVNTTTNGVAVSSGTARVFLIKAGTR